jgi:MFS family permease
LDNEEVSSRDPIKNILTRDFVLGFLALFTFLTSMSALFPTFPIFLMELGSSERETGILIGVFGASSFVIRFLVGGALTRYQEKSLMMAGAFLFALTFLACITFRPFWPFFAVRIVQGAAVACVDTAAFTAIVNVTPLPYRGRAIGYLMIAAPLSLAIAPPFALSFSNRYGFTAFFLLCMVLCLCAFSLSWKMGGQEGPGSRQGTSAENKVFLDRRIVAPSVGGSLQGFVFGSLVAFVPLYAIERGVTNPGLFFSAIAVMLIVSRVLGGRVMDTCSKEKTILTFGSVCMIAMIILSFSKTLLIFIFVGLLFGLGHAFFVPVSMAYALDYAGSSEGTAVGTFRGFADLGQAVGPMVLGLIIPFAGYTIMFLCLAFICFINLAYFQFYVRKKGSVTCGKSN